MREITDSVTKSIYGENSRVIEVTSWEELDFVTSRVATPSFGIMAINWHGNKKGKQELVSIALVLTECLDMSPELEKRLKL